MNSGKQFATHRKWISKSIVGDDNSVWISSPMLLLLLLVTMQPANGENFYKISYPYALPMGIVLRIELTGEWNCVSVAQPIEVVAWKIG